MQADKYGLNIKNSFKITIYFIIVIAIAFGIYYLFTNYQIREVTVTGNTHYTEEEMIEFLELDKEGNNSLLLFLKNKIEPMKDIPFVERVEIEYNWPDKIEIQVYEKMIAGCIEYIGEYIYFDREGVVLETSSEKLTDVPLVLGLKFDYFALHKILPIQDSDKFDLILNLTQLIGKYEVGISKIRFDTNDELILYSGEIKIIFGDTKELDEKLAEIKNMLDRAKEEGYTKGTLHMEDFNTENRVSPFYPSGEE